MKNILTKLTLALATTVMLSSTAPAAVKRAPQPAPATAATVVADAPTTFAVASRTTSSEASKLTRAEKRTARKAVLKALRGADSDSKKIIAAIIAIFVGFIGPAIAMFIIDGDFTNRVLIALLLGLLFHLPGMIYALIQIFKD